MNLKCYLRLLFLNSHATIVTYYFEIIMLIHLTGQALMSDRKHKTTSNFNSSDNEATAKTGLQSICTGIKRHQKSTKNTWKTLWTTYTIKTQFNDHYHFSLCRKIWYFLCWPSICPVELLMKMQRQLNMSWNSSHFCMLLCCKTYVKVLRVSWYKSSDLLIVRNFISKYILSQILKYVWD